jgi:hypothetical protein
MLSNVGAGQGVSAPASWRAPGLKIEASGVYSSFLLSSPPPPLDLNCRALVCEWQVDLPPHYIGMSMSINTELSYAKYGKTAVRVFRVVRDGKWHHVIEYNVTALLQGKIETR